MKPRGVMAGLVPAIYVAPLARILQISTVGTAWISGTSPISANFSRLRASGSAFCVMTGLVPVIHVAVRCAISSHGGNVPTWMPGTRPGMTDRAALKLAPMGLVPAIYVAPLARILQISTVGTAWISGTSPGMTIQGCVGSRICNHIRFPGQPCLRDGGKRFAFPGGWPKAG